MRRWLTSLSLTARSCMYMLTTSSLSQVNGLRHCHRVRDRVVAVAAVS